MTEMLHSKAPRIVDADPVGTEYRDPDEIAVASLSRLERTYCKRSEQLAGKVSRRELNQRIGAAQGETLAQRRRSGAGVAFRAAPDSRGVSFTESVKLLDPDEVR